MVNDMTNVEYLSLCLHGWKSDLRIWMIQALFFKPWVHKYSVQLDRTDFELNWEEFGAVCDDIR